MNQIFTILSGSEKSQIDSSDSNITFLIVDHELCLQKAYNDLYEKVVKVKKLNQKFFNKLTNMENEKNNLAEALMSLKIKISRSITKLKALRKR